MIAQAKAAGIELVPDNSSSSVLLAERLPAMDYESILFTWVLGGGLDPRELYACAGAQNHLGYCSDGVDSLLQDAATEVDPAVRAQLLNDANRALAEDVPTIPLFRRPAFLVQRETLRGPRLNPAGLATWNVEAWSLGTTFVVNSDADPGDGTCDATCTLRDAIDNANAAAGDDRIEFAIGSGRQTISLASALPFVTDPVVIDATTQPGYAGRPLIQLDGADAGASTPGFEISAGGSTVRGFSITNFSWDGVKMHEGDGNIVEDNWIGVFEDGGEPGGAGNGTYGVLADFGSSANVIRRNVIGANGFGAGGPYSGIGIWHDATDNVVEDNRIGLTPASAVFPNAIGVIVADTTGAYLTANTIAQNAGAGVTVFGAASGNRIVGNSIFANGGLGIDLGFDGVTPNDEGDTDSGANAKQNFPVITDVSSADGMTTVTGTIDGVSGPFFDFDLYANDACDGSGNGEGATHLAEGVAAVDATAFSISFPGLSVSVGSILTATATVLDNTSEFGPCAGVADSDTLTVTTAADSNDGDCTPANCSLREAIATANALGGRQTIGFAIPPGGAQTIALVGVPLQITDPVTIDATTQTGQPHGIVVNAAGLNTMSSTQGALHLAAGSGGSILRGLVVNAADTNGILITSNGNTVESSRLGTNGLGTAAVPNGVGIRVTGSSNTIGGLAAAARNVISGNQLYGVLLNGAENTVIGNYVGLAADGLAPLGNDRVEFDGIGIFVTGSNNVVGRPDAGNVIAASPLLISIVGEGVPGNVVQGNLLGTDRTGIQAVGRARADAGRHLALGNR